MAGRSIIVHSLEHARAAVGAAAATGVPVTLLSAEGAAGTVGAAWFREVVAAASAERPEVAVTAILDCGDKPGHVLGALRQGLKSLRFTGPKATAERLAQIAAQEGATLTKRRGRALDLLDVPDPAAACRKWLSGGVS